MIVFKDDIMRLVFKYFMMIYLIGGGQFSAILSAQLRTNSQWSETAKSLTIFQPGDAVRIQVWELGNRDETLNNIISRDYPINPSGDIVVPIIGEVRVIGLTEIELIQTLQEKLKAYLNDPYVLVRPLIRVTMQGAFQNPGAYRVDPSNSFWDLVALAGGPTSNCNLEGMWVERGGKVVKKKLLDYFERGYSLEDVGIESGDQIIAPARGRMDFYFYINIINLLTSIVLLYLRLRAGYW